MIRNKLILCGAMILIITNASAQDYNLQINAELRPRAIVNHGYKSPLQKDKRAPFYVSQRTRAGALFSNNKFEAFISMQDIRLWGDDNNYNRSGAYGNTESISLYQAWVRLFLSKPFSLKIGRQSFSYDDQRILSARNRNDYQVTYDALLAEYKTFKNRLHLGISYNADSKSDLLYPAKKIKSLNFIHYQYQIDKLVLSGIAVGTGKTLSDTTELLSFKGTYGANINYKTSKLNARLSLYFQHNLNDIGGRISAYCASFDVKYKLTERLSMDLGIDHLSGTNETSKSSVCNQFDILYGRRHGWYGYMDFFSTTPPQGLEDHLVKLTYEPTSVVTIHLQVHHFMLAADKYDVMNPPKRLSSQLGQEMDFVVKWKFDKMAALEFGYSIYGATRTLKQMKGFTLEDIKSPQFCYLMLILKPSINIVKNEK